MCTLLHLKGGKFNKKHPPQKKERKERVPNEETTRARKHSQEPDRAAPTTAPAPTGTRTNTCTYSNGCSVHDGEFASVTSRMVNPLTRYGWTISGRRCASGEPEEGGNGREERRRQNQQKKSKGLRRVWSKVSTHRPLPPPRSTSIVRPPPSLTLPVDCTAAIDRDVCERLPRCTVFAVGSNLLAGPTIDQPLPCRVGCTCRCGSADAGLSVAPANPCDVAHNV